MGKEAAYTSIKQIPAGFKVFQLGYQNLDWGGGKYDLATWHMRNEGTYNVVYDEFNQSPERQTMAWRVVTREKTSSVTVFNVLNVIQSKSERATLLKRINKYCNYQKKRFNEYPVVIFQIYEGNRSGIPSTKTVQNNMKTAAYLPEIQKAFPKWEPQRQGNFIIV